MAEYFNQFEKINYDVKGNGKYLVMTNLMLNVKIKDKIKEYLVAFDSYDVVAGETPEIISHFYYEDSSLYWVILLTNNIVNYHNQWPLSVPAFEAYLNSKYNDVNQIHHYEIYQTSGDKSVLIKLPNNANHPNAIPVTNYNYEEELQKQKAKIRLLRPEYIEKFVREFENIVKG